jgi:predicted permease
MSTLRLRVLPWLEDLRRDVPYGLRSFARAPGFTIVAVLTLALGIGANTAIFSVVDAVLLRPLPYAYDSDRLVRLMAHLPNAESPNGAPRRVTVGFTAAEVHELRSRTRVLSHVAIVGPTLMGLSGREEAARLQGARVSASAFPLLGTRPFLGRPILPADEEPGRDDVILLGHAAWQRYFGGDAAIVGRTLTLETVLGPRMQRQYSVIGVMPPEFAFPSSQTQFWMPPFVSTSGQGAGFRGQMLGRLAPDVTIQAAAGELTPIVRAIRQHGPDVRYELVREQDELVSPVRPALLVLMGAVGFVLLIACVNVANLQLARTMARGRELAVRTALGAGRSRLVRQALTESVMLAALGGLAGIAFAMGGVRLLRRLASTLTRMDLGGGAAFPRIEEIGIDVSVLAFAAGASLVTGVLFGLAPAVRQAGADPIDALRNATSRASGAGRGSLRGALVVAQIAMALVLLVGAALLMRSFANLSSIDPGYDAGNVLTFQVALPAGTYSDARLKSFAETVVGRLQSIPGVRAAAYANQLPMVQLRDTAGGLWRTPDAARRPAPGGADARLVSRDYFDVMGIRVVAGRGFHEGDREGQPRVLLINETLARRGFQNENPVGLQVYVGRDPVPWEIVGVVGDVRQFGLDREPEPQFFADLRQWSGTGLLFPVGAYYAVRVDREPDAVLPALRAIVRGLNAQAALFNVARMETLVATTISRPRMYTVLLFIFAAVGVALAAIGIYGVMAYVVTQRTAEIGIRMALGAQRAEVLSLILRQGLMLTAAGIVAGLVGAAALTRYLEGMLFGVTAFDRTTFAAATLVLALVAMVASYMPARRATRVDPLLAIRSE